MRQAGAQRCALIRIAPTQLLLPRGAMPGRGAPVGEWTIGVRSASASPGDVFAFIARSTHGMGGHRRSYQSCFMDPSTERFSLNGLVSGQSAWAIGGYRVSDGKPADYSSRGPSRPLGRFQTAFVDAVAPTEESLMLHGIRGWGNSSAASVRMGGTSVAAPLAAHLARRAAPLRRATPTDTVDAPLQVRDICL
jgi:hypothetical protein